MPEIRPMAEDDIDEAARLHVRSWQSGYAGIIPADFLASLDPDVFAARRRAQPILAGAGSLVATVDGQIAGLAGFGPYRPEQGEVDPTTGELYAIYVDPEHWRAGIGRRLHAAVTAALTGSGFRAMRLWVLEENHRARRFYEWAGMRPDGARQLWTPRGTSHELPEVRYAIEL
jgi:GNAT superfamily N-acetyltransferase